MKRRFNNIKTEINVLMRGARLAEEYRGKNFILLNIAEALFSVMSSYISIYMSGKVITAITKSDATYKEVLLFAILAVLPVLICNVINRIIHRRILIMRSCSDKKHSALLSQKALTFDCSQSEDEKIINLRAKIYESTQQGNGIARIPEQITKIVTNAVSVIIAVVMIFKINLTNSEISLTSKYKFIESPLVFFLFIVFVVFCIAITVLANSKSVKKYFKIDDKLLKYQNRLDYYTDKVLNENEPGKDIRIFKSISLILNDFNKYIFTPRKEYADEKAKIDVIYGSVAQITNAILGGCVYLLIGLKALVGIITVGEVVTCYGAVMKLINSITVLSSSFSFLKSNNMYIKQELEYLDLTSEMTKGTIKLDSTNIHDPIFEFHNVSFTYPGTNKKVLDKINVKFSSNERIAIVGLNGSGKTTLIKLLCRLYDPTEGFITLNGTDIKEYNYGDYLNLFSVVFQDYKIFSFSVLENVVGGNFTDLNKAWECLEKVDMAEYISKLPEKINTGVSNLYVKNGINFSVGETQKIAIARALYKAAPITILDEPTSALDPITESEIYAKFNNITNDKIKIFISHRLSSCRFCDKVFVIDKGLSVQEGSHDDLMRNKLGLYYKLWSSQSCYYND